MCMAETTTVRETERKYSGGPIDADLAAALATVAAEATNASAGPPRARAVAPRRPWRRDPRHRSSTTRASVRYLEIAGPAELPGYGRTASCCASGGTPPAWGMDAGRRRRPSPRHGHVGGRGWAGRSGMRFHRPWGRRAHEVGSVDQTPWGRGSRRPGRTLPGRSPTWGRSPAPA